MSSYRLLFLLLVYAPSTWVKAHEGHRPLPTRGMEVDVKKGSMVMTKAARETLDMKTVEVTPQSIYRSDRRLVDVKASLRNRYLRACVRDTFSYFDNGTQRQVDRAYQNRILKIKRWAGAFAHGPVIEGIHKQERHSAECRTPPTLVIDVFRFPIDD